MIAPSALARDLDVDLEPPRFFTLRSGRRVELRAPVVPFVPEYRVLSWPKPNMPAGEAPASHEEIDEMFALAHAIARERGERLFGDAGCFAVLFNGARARRMPWPHFHLIPARSPAERRFVLFCLLLKRLSRRALRALPRGVRRRLLHA
ncbi:MAG: hypothetical protein ACK6CU_29315 [Deltaproteobacteria bacterium]|jgi:hypothetical protein